MCEDENCSGRRDESIGIVFVWRCEKEVVVEIAFGIGERFLFVKTSKWR